MKTLIDTHVFLWMIAAPEKLEPMARDTLANPDTEVFVSIASAWEIAIKRDAGKIDVDDAVGSWFSRHAAEARIQTLGIEADSFNYLTWLPPHHRDPFDRLLIAQAMARKLVLCTRDAMIRRYDIPVLVA